MEERGGGRKVAREGKEGNRVNINKEKCKTGHLQWKIWAHLESIGVMMDDIKESRAQTGRKKGQVSGSEN